MQRSFDLSLNKEEYPLKKLLLDSKEAAVPAEEASDDSASTDEGAANNQGMLDISYNSF